MHLWWDGNVIRLIWEDQNLRWIHYHCRRVSTQCVGNSCPLQCVGIPGRNRKGGAPRSSSDVRFRGPPHRKPYDSSTAEEYLFHHHHHHYNYYRHYYRYRHRHHHRESLLNSHDT